MVPDGDAIPVVVLGGTGYVSGELLRLLAGHPRFRIAAVASTSHPGDSVVGAFPHLAGTRVDGLRFADMASVAGHFTRGRDVGIFAATPHGSTAALLDGILTAAEHAGAHVRAVDLSADFRFRDADTYAAIYGKPHGAPARLSQFVCAVPEHASTKPPLHVAQPGCFTTATVCAAAPFLALKLVEPDVFVSAVTGSSGSGRTPAHNTHHPERHSTLYAYAPLAHRHEAEMRALLGAAAQTLPPAVAFVPHSGPFVRGIHATLRMTLLHPASAEALVERVNEYYAAAPFVSAATANPRLIDVVGTNRCALGITTRDRTLVVTSVLDNLTKGAAGGGVQWMNRLFDLDDDAGLRIPGLGWY